MEFSGRRWRKQNEKKKRLGVSNTPEKLEHSNVFRCRKTGVVLIFWGCTKIFWFKKWSVPLLSTLQLVLMTFPLDFPCSHFLRMIFWCAIRIKLKTKIRTFKIQRKIRMCSYLYCSYHVYKIRIFNNDIYKIRRYINTEFKK